MIVQKPAGQVRSDGNMTNTPLSKVRGVLTGQVSNFRAIAGTGAMPAPAPETIYDPEVVADACLKSQSLTDRNKSFAGISFFLDPIKLSIRIGSESVS